MNVTLINPFRRFGLNRYVHRFMHVPGVTLPYLASLIPSYHSVTIQDEAVSPVNYDHPSDLVAITAMTANVRRAYQISDEFRKRGVKVVIGGPHVSALPEEASQFCDAVAIGNSETMISRIVADAEQNQLQPVYHNRLPTELTHPMHLSASNRWVTSLMASRGCELNCEFCTMQNVFGKFYLQRNLEHVLKEINDSKTRRLFFVDDNFYGASSGSRIYYDQVLKELQINKKKWVAQCRLPVLRSDETVHRFARSGCQAVLLGFESLNPKNKLQVEKQKISRDHYFGDIQRIHRHGIGVIGSFIFGFDEDTPETIDETLEFCIDSGIEVALFTVLTPFPGTALYNRLSSEGRLISKEWNDYTMHKCVYTPIHFTPSDLEKKVVEITNKFYSFRSIMKRAKVGMAYDLFKEYYALNILRRLALASKI